MFRFKPVKINTVREIIKSIRSNAKGTDGISLLMINITHHIGAR